MSAGGKMERVTRSERKKTRLDDSPGRLAE